MYTKIEKKNKYTLIIDEKKTRLIYNVIHYMSLI